MIPHVAAWACLLLAGSILIAALPSLSVEPASLLRGGTPPFIDCLYETSVPLSLVGTPNFTQQAESFNLRLNYTPAAIVFPNDYRDVSKAISCASGSEVKIQARSGGHSYASYSLGGQDGSLVIDLQRLQQIDLDTRTGIVTVGAGVRLGNLAQGIYDQGKRALPHGSCPGVGIGGHATHGGYGHTSRMWGLTLDTIVAMDVVLSSGITVHTNETSYPDLFFALRGAADSFGIITTFYLKTFPAPEHVVNFDINVPAALHSKECAASAFEHLQAFAQNASVVNRNISFEISTNGTTYKIWGMYFAGLDRFQSEIMPEMLRGLPAPDLATTKIVELGWIDLLENLGWKPLAQPLIGYNEHDTFFAKSIVTQQARPLTRDALEAFFGYVLENGRNRTDPWFAIIALYGGPDSQINIQSANSSAYPHRSALWVLQLYGASSNHLPPFNSTIEPFISGLTDSITHTQPDGGFQAYANYVDPTLSPTQAHYLYYGAELYAKLVKIKGVLDPTGLFWNPQTIGTS